MAPIATQARGVLRAKGQFEPMEVDRRDPGPTDVVIAIAFCGICHSDIHYVHDDFGRSSYPLVPGHEISGIVTATGPAVGKFAVGDRVGVGVMVDTCRSCAPCRSGSEQYCTGSRTLTYNSRDRHGAITYGGYSKVIVVDEDFVVHIPDALELEVAAPLLCAGITMYSPLRHWAVGPGSRVGIIGMGGLGHLGVQLAAAMGASVTVFDLDPGKHPAALKLGATAFYLASDASVFSRLNGNFDLLLSTVPVSLDMDAWLGLLALNGTLVNTGVPGKPLSIEAVSLLNNRRSVAGTRSGSLAEIQEMLDFCALHGIGAEIELIGPDQIDEAFDRVLRGDVRFRFVIDLARPAGDAG